MEFASANGRRLGIIVDFVTVMASFFVTFFIETWIEGHVPFAYQGRTYFETYAFLTLTGTLSLLFVEYPVKRLTTWWHEAKIALRLNVIIVLLFSAFSFLLNLHSFSRLFIGTYSIVNILFMAANRGLIRTVLGVRRKAGWNVKTRLIVGCGAMANLYLDKVKQHPQIGIRVIGYIATKIETMPLPYLGQLTDLREVLAVHQIDGVVITLPMTDPRIEQVIEECDLQGTPMELTLDSLSSKLVYSQLVNGMGLPRLTLSQVPHAPNAVLLKRVTDIILSGLALLALSPIFLLIAMAIKLEDGGPVFFAQTRTGQFGRLFQIHKFRSMRVNAEQMREQLLHLNEMSGPVFKITSDPRVTRVGNWLRKLSLDELPQFYDVLIGTMSLVGPRPPLPSEVKQYDAQYRRRLSVKPGITCLWQISGRNTIDFDAWMDLDLAYIDNWSYAEDMRILMKTIPAVLRGHGAS